MHGQKNIKLLTIVKFSKQYLTVSILRVPIVRDSVFSGPIRSFLCWVQNSAEVRISVCTLYSSGIPVLPFDLFKCVHEISKGDYVFR